MSFCKYDNELLLICSIRRPVRKEIKTGQTAVAFFSPYQYLNLTFLLGTAILNNVRIHHFTVTYEVLKLGAVE
jgi:hypothetical protein